MAIFDFPTAQKLFHKDGQARLDRHRGEVGRRRRRSSSSEIRPILPPTAQVRTGAGGGEAGDEGHERRSSRIFKDFLLAFGGVALFVGSFVIANTLSITIAQRTRELATLRTLGATRRQVLMSVLLEAFVIGAARVGDRPLPRPRAREGPELALRLASASTCRRPGPCSRRGRSSSRSLVGIVVTLLAALRPAIRATRVPPISAVREGAVLPTSRFARFSAARRAADDRRRGRADARRPLRRRRSRRRSACSRSASARPSSSSASRMLAKTLVPPLARGVTRWRPWR